MILTEPAVQAIFGRKLRVRALGAFLDEARAAARLRGAVSVLLTHDEQIRRLNRQFRKKNKPTDVLSFPAAEMDGPADRLAGDLAISVETAARQAEEMGHSLAMELQVLVLHGLLHLAGYDHETDQGEMARRERGLRQKLGLRAGLIERAAEKPAARTKKKAAKRTAVQSKTAGRRAAGHKPGGSRSGEHKSGPAAKARGRRA